MNTCVPAEPEEWSTGSCCVITMRPVTAVAHAVRVSKTGCHVVEDGQKPPSPNTMRLYLAKSELDIARHMPSSATVTTEPEGKYGCSPVSSGPKNSTLYGPALHFGAVRHAPPPQMP